MDNTPTALDLQTHHARIFAAQLEVAYADLFQTDPAYAYSAMHTTPEALAIKMTLGLARGGANKDGKAIQRACKVLGVRHTYTAIKAYLLDTSYHA